ncbi:hypothetical protein [Jannaschia aquimarina]|uniref:Uncharacterized protein n=1 Tax=Jannaschia aquimarina TaxID=935700 RepID=A0A0D1EF75_9RHOB|nr:hypothetical protein [Jannaschia aquimarina]KIT16279.1 hypothetical protein jaqu_20330 [Jannaschia aquimarina]SNT14719.1 hypothetical protein SAMN05421775_106192 [Jannaschia aquimarina]
MTRTYDQPFAQPSEYEREQAYFAEMHHHLQRRKRARWRLWLALRVAGRR